MNTKVHKSVTPLYVVAAAWLLYALLLPLYSLWHYICAVAVTAVIGLVAKALCPDVTAEEAKEAEPVKPKSSGDPALDEMVSDCTKAISEMKRLDKNIEDAKISAQIVRLQQSTDKIMAHVKDNPDKLPQIRKFMNYYLPTTLKLLNSYDRMGAQGVDGENITATMDKVDNIMDTIVIAFEKQLDSLFGSEALDISTDVTVLENMLAREGLTDDGMKKAVSQAAETAATAQTAAEEKGDTIEAGGITLTL